MVAVRLTGVVEVGSAGVGARGGVGRCRSQQRSRRIGGLCSGEQDGGAVAPANRVCLVAVGGEKAQSVDKTGGQLDFVGVR
jgi:hypothetical protein